MKISATVIVKNEEKNISDCLNSLDFADEIIVVDSGSSDRTGAICRSHPKVRFYERAWEGFGRQKDIAADLAVNDWIFNIDADERVSPILKSSIMSAPFEKYDGFRVARENYFGSRWIRRCGWYPDYNLRLYDRNKCRYGERAVHEAVSCQGLVSTLSGNLLHFTYEGTGDYLRRMERYSTLAAEQMITDGRRPGFVSLLVRPIFTFFKMYVMKGGVLEGHDGFILSSLYACYTFCKYAKAIEMVRKGH